ncbi:MAG: leucine--tRNA ligase [Chloroflexi bacterium]|nr:leucine--tRNA ligase [Chloroflexota bacterium]
MYDPTQIEKKWQAQWEQDALYLVNDDDASPKWYSLTMFPYTSGDLHIGHWYAEAPADTYARYKRMCGYNVLRPIGFDAFGLPAENAAIKRGIHPREWTLGNIANMTRQLKSMGSCYDWNREVVTCLSDYYRWTQWFFLKLFKENLAYRKKAPVNWCPSCQAVLANEQVEDGKCWRCESQVIQKDLEQWFFGITKYAAELANHEGIDWPEKIKIMQRNWVGRSEGADISFLLEKPAKEYDSIKIFTTRPDTAYGVTFMTIAPEHPMVEYITTPEQKEEVTAYQQRSREKNDIERLSTEKEKDGVFTGAYCYNPLNDDKIPVYIGDYVLISYGTGAVMAVPAHDTRDFAFAKKYNLPIKVVIASPNYNGEELSQAYIESGSLINSGRFDSMNSEEAKKAIAEYLTVLGKGGPSVNYKLRDWLISRQRYWGAPIPIVYCNSCGLVPVNEEELPVLLPEKAEFKLTGENPLKYNEEFVNTTCPKCNRLAKRETDTMDTFMCSSWYFMRYTSPHSPDAPFYKENVEKWMPVDLYTGGAEHAVMHLFYARFLTKALRDMGYVNFSEPFSRLFNQGLILAQGGGKMSKSKGNTVTPDDLVIRVGADAVRAFLMFIGPWDQGGEWNDAGLNGISRWLQRIWSLVIENYQEQTLNEKDTRDFVRAMHRTIAKVGDDLEKLRFNTMLATLMEYSNYLNKVKTAGSVPYFIWQEAMKNLILMLAPSTPHITEEMWQIKGQLYSVHQQAFPQYDAELATEEEITLVVQINGRVRDKINAPIGLTAQQAEDLARSSEKILSFTEGRQIEKVIYVAGRLLNIVVK